MNIHKHKYKSSGFTLIELLTVIAIIGILAGILIPTIGLVRKNAAKAKSQSDLRQIALAYNSFSSTGPRARTVGSGAYTPGGTQTLNIEGWAFVMAEFGGLNDAAVYFIDSAPDVAILPAIPQTVLNLTVSPPVPAANWAGAAAAISYKAAIALPPNSRGPITPLIWTKGNTLGTTPNWGDTAAPGQPWENEGGHIAFLDGHVNYYNSTTGQLEQSNGTVVNTILEALPTGASVTL